MGPFGEETVSPAGSGGGVRERAPPIQNFLTQAPPNQRNKHGNKVDMRNCGSSKQAGKTRKRAAIDEW